MLQVLPLPQTRMCQMELADGLEAFTGLAIGYPGEASMIPDEYAQRDRQPRERKALAEIILAGSIG